MVSALPRAYLPLSTMFRPENVETSVERAHELSDFCGIPPHELVHFRPERLIVHELLVRVTADLSVPDGPNDEDLGINFRQMAAVILERYIKPHLGELIGIYETVRQEATAKIGGELHDRIVPREEKTSDARGTGLLRRLVGRSEPASSVRRSPPDGRPERQALGRWRALMRATDDPFDTACYEALVATVTAILNHRGRLLGDRTLVAGLAVTMVCNGHGSRVIGDAIDRYVREAAVGEGYAELPTQAAPVVMNVKGASASGKSTMRPLQRTLAERLDIPWRDFALISPDIWRKFLLEYDTLGAAYKYAGTMTGHEVAVIDGKLDRYMATKASGGRITHLLVDRFRFDSFAPEADVAGSSSLLTRFGRMVYLFFMITPPHMTVERAWYRGLKIGRYKAVDDLLFHNVEAYLGMPQLFFTWALRNDRRVHYEFLDNSVSDGRRPRTVAYGWNGEMNILDVKCLIDVERFRKINVDAKRPEEVYPGREMAAIENLDFLRKCVRSMPVINFADFESGKIYAQLRDGRWTYRDRDYLPRSGGDEELRLCLDALAAGAGSENSAGPAGRLDPSKAQTLGTWGGFRAGNPPKADNADQDS